MMKKVLLVGGLVLMMAAVTAGSAFAATAAKPRKSSATSKPAASQTKKAASSSQRSYAAPAPAPFLNTVSANPLGLVLGIFNLEYERVLSADNAVAGRLNFGGWGTGDWQTSYVGLGGSYRWFISPDQQIPRGVWLGPAMDFQNISTTHHGQTASSMFCTIAGEVGYKWLFGDKVAFALSPFANLGYTMGSLKVGNDTLPYGGVSFGIGLSLGVAFY